LSNSVSDLQAQIDRLNLALQQWRQSQEPVPIVEQRLRELTDRCNDILGRWTDTDRRHAHAINEVEERLHEWSAIEHRLQQDAAQRLRELERSIEHEWQALRRVHEEPARQLREQAAALGETCMAAANLALRSFERAEARLSALETDLQAQIRQLTQEVRAALAEARRDQPASSQLPPAAPFPLESVMRIHDDVRASNDDHLHEWGGLTSETPAAPPDRDLPKQLPEASRLEARLEQLERAVSAEQDSVRETLSHSEQLRRRSRRWIAAGVVAVAVLALGGILVWQRISTRLDEAAARAAAAERQAAQVSDDAARQLAATRADADRQISEARQSAQQAQMITHVLAAPDLVRFNLSGAPPSDRASAQVLWSRTRGIVVSAARLSPTPGDAVYQVWLAGNGVNASAGSFTPDAIGSAILAAENPPDLPFPVTGVFVTVEPAGGARTPSGATVLARGQ
jgi:hypothetical protein